MVIKEIAIRTEINGFYVLLEDKLFGEDKDHIAFIERKIQGDGEDSIVFNFVMIFNKDNDPKFFYRLACIDDAKPYTYHHRENGDINLCGTNKVIKEQVQSHLEDMKTVIFKLMRKYNIEDNGILSDYLYEEKLAIEKQYHLHDDTFPLIHAFTYKEKEGENKNG